jgi:hypothetical protein
LQAIRSLSVWPRQNNSLLSTHLINQRGESPLLLEIQMDAYIFLAVYTVYTALAYGVLYALETLEK